MLIVPYIFILFISLANSQGFSISLNNMEPPKTELFYSQEFPKSGDTLYLKVAIPQGWHINSNNVLDDFLVPSNVETISECVDFDSAIWPKPISVRNEILNMDLLLLQDSFVVALPVKTIAKNCEPYSVKLKFTYQACSNICLAPKTIDVFFNENNQKKNFNSKTNKTKYSFLMYILFAFLGGLLLNIMPCVLPVLFIKIFDLMKRFGQDRTSMLKWGLATMGGIYFSFAAIAIAVIAIRAGGNAVGWGFQFQHPAYTATMALCIALFALNLWGVFEIWLPGNAFKGLEKQVKQGGFYGAFAHGILLVLLSTPCSAPFLGTAAGFAFTASTIQFFAIFFALATGLSLPYLLLSIFPGWANKLPKPGRWMELFKQFLGFPLLLTLVWLFWVFYRQTGVNASLSLGIIICTAAFFAWLAGIVANPGKPWWRFAFLWLVFSAIYSLSWNLWIYPQVDSSPVRDYGEEWIPFSQKKLDSLQNEGIAVWVNGTADWCINCKVNEKNSFENEKVKNAFAKTHIVKMKLDYTIPNEESTKLFETYGRSGVPFDLLLTSENKAILMPEFLYPDIIIKALEVANQ